MILASLLLPSFFNDAAKNLRSRVEAVSEYVIFAEAVTAGEFYTGQKIRIRAGKYPGYADAAAERVVIGHRKQTDAGVPDAHGALRPDHLHDHRDLADGVPAV